MTDLIEVRVPDLGDFKDVEIIDVLVKEGDAVEVEGPLITLETEKATMDVPSTVAGVVRELKVKRGDRVSMGDLVALVEGTASAASATAEAGNRTGRHRVSHDGQLLRLPLAQSQLRF